MQCASIKYEIIRKPIILKREEVNLLKSARYYQKQNFEIISYLFRELLRKKWVDLWNLTEIEITESMATFRALQTWIGHNATPAGTCVILCWDLPGFWLISTHYHALPPIFKKKWRMGTRCKEPQNMLNWEKMCGNACGNALKLC